MVTLGFLLAITSYWLVSIDHKCIWTRKLYVWKVNTLCDFIIGSLRIAFVHLCWNPSGPILISLHLILPKHACANMYLGSRPLITLSVMWKELYMSIGHLTWGLYPGLISGAVVFFSTALHSVHFSICKYFIISITFWVPFCAC